MLKALFFTTVSFSSTKIGEGQPLGVVDISCIDPYTLDEETGTCTGTEIVDFLCPQGYTLDLRTCYCRSSKGSKFSKCQYGFFLNKNTCKCEAPEVCM